MRAHSGSKRAFDWHSASCLVSFPLSAPPFSPRLMKLDNQHWRLKWLEEAYGEKAKLKSLN